MRKAVVSKIAAVVAVAAGAVGATAIPAGADVGAQSPPIAGVQVGSPARIGSWGAVVTVPITVLCIAGGQGYAVVEVEQASGPLIAGGVGSTDLITCDGTSTSVPVAVPSVTVPFRLGSAFATAVFEVCDSTGCLQARDQREIRIGL